MSEPALAVTDLSVRYGAAATALTGIDLMVPRGEIVTLLGPNGAGKSTLMRAVSGLLHVHGGVITSGRVELLGSDVTSDRPAARVRRGLAQALEGRQVFPDLTVAENLAAGGHVRRYRKAQAREALERALSHLPRLHDLMDRKAGYLSGGEQQMLAIGRALMSQPTVLLLDEPSLGLAPKIVETVRDIILDIRDEGTSILLVEQNAAMALSIAQHGYVLESGRIVRSGAAADLRDDDEIAALYLGVSASEGAGSHA
ncbi:ATP-binding cassette domain-containing protein [Nocardioides sp. MAH-18]|uniref:ATP-binding cassette domain-containing protein n=1 Tax=Nocardioides agri TaxID=2682843 RepID=A0A6L6XN37_9ACTN|nr:MULTISPECIES: ABC transporter ATP-binding protein [unclassified Nocardioides]MBA2953804.1 ABC transporter ATP-binding protein [Nocardioides sp. CGMCC 1.13656]MVQ48669.1 ATP-binding cassette domain-containing protein [Nocardioides sp. MAH-18]